MNDTTHLTTLQRAQWQHVQSARDRNKNNDLNNFDTLDDDFTLSPPRRHSALPQSAFGAGQHRSTYQREQRSPLQVHHQHPLASSLEREVGTAAAAAAHDVGPNNDEFDSILEQMQSLAVTEQEVIFKW